MEQNYAFIKDSMIVNIAIFDNPSQELLETIKTNLDLDNIVLATEKTLIGGTWNGTNFIPPKPYTSWILNENDYWVSPIEYPNDGKIYQWDENTTSWIEDTE